MKDLLIITTEAWDLEYHNEILLIKEKTWADIKVLWRKSRQINNWWVMLDLPSLEYERPSKEDIIEYKQIIFLWYKPELDRFKWIMHKKFMKTRRLDNNWEIVNVDYWEIEDRIKFYLNRLYWWKHSQTWQTFHYWQPLHHYFKWWKRTELWLSDLLSFINDVKNEKNILKIKK